MPSTVCEAHPKRWSVLWPSINLCGCKLLASRVAPIRLRIRKTVGERIDSRTIEKPARCVELSDKSLTNKKATGSDIRRLSCSVNEHNMNSRSSDRRNYMYRQLTLPVKGSITYYRRMGKNLAYNLCNKIFRTAKSTSYIQESHRKTFSGGFLALTSNEE